MEKYWKAGRSTPTNRAVSTEVVIQTTDESILSDFDRHRLTLLSTNQAEEEGWESEMRRYLKDIPADVTKETDIVKWWEVCAGDTRRCMVIVIN